MNTTSYQHSKDAALHTLLKCSAKELPLDLMPVCKKLGIRITSYNQALGFIQCQGLVKIVQNTEGLAFYVQNTPVILYNADRPPERVRFTIAHEIGHLVLGHVAPVETLQ